MSKKALVAGYALLLLAIGLQDWTPLLVYILAMLGREYFLNRKARREQGSDAAVG
jgi:hypothetical protein